MSRLVAGSGFALDFDEARLANGFVHDAFTTQPASGALAAGTNTVTVARVADGRWHDTSLTYSATGSGNGLTARFTGLIDRDAGGAQRYRIEGVDVALPTGQLDRLGVRIFQGLTEIVGAEGDDVFYMGVPGGRSFDGGAGSDRAVYGADPPALRPARRRLPGGDPGRRRPGRRPLRGGVRPGHRHPGGGRDRHHRRADHGDRRRRLRRAGLSGGKPRPCPGLRHRHHRRRPPLRPDGAERAAHGRRLRRLRLSGIEPRRAGRRRDRRGLRRNVTT
ncbi:hypothetical protein ACIU1J_31640 [Azospirillum doebereinerae]|uniref:hypothetical protein n=1 Tax=Azospirillum doebereinerae TaxID=92933 RepID=UPI0038511FD4